jgi:ubiquinol-cytochrome c reductase cytochrome c subunit
MAFIVAALLAAATSVGGVLYTVHCSSCHGADLRGTGNGPSLQHAGAAAVDFMLRTGRMPLEVPDTEDLPAPPQLTPEQIDAVLAYTLAHGAASGPPIPAIGPSTNLARGRVLFDDNCQACHGALGTGATTGYGWIAPALHDDSGTQIAEAVRFGPGIMPHFDSRLISDTDLNALVAYVLTLRQPPDIGGYSVESSGPVGEGLLAWIIGIGAAVIVMMLVGETLRTSSRSKTGMNRPGGL